MKKLIYVIVLMAGTLMAADPATAAMSSPSYRIPTAEFSSGGAALSSDNYQMDTILGQSSPLMEDNLPPGSASYTLYPGFWYTLESALPSPVCECDVSSDGQCTPQDALCTFQKYLVICPTACGACEDICCDANNDGQCTPADALCRFQKYLVIPSCLD